jgi:hypothetical protein
MTGGFLPAAALPIAGVVGSALAKPILEKVGNKIAGWFGLGMRRRGRGVVRAGATRATGGARRVRRTRR